MIMLKHTLSFLFVVFSTAVFAQQVNVSKTDGSISSPSVEISAAAIPFDQIGTVVIDSSTYHKAVVNGEEPETSHQLKEVSAAAVPASEHISSGTIKEAITVGGGREVNTVNRTVRAEPVPKR